MKTDASEKQSTRPRRDIFTGVCSIYSNKFWICIAFVASVISIGIIIGVKVSGIKTEYNLWPQEKGKKIVEQNQCTH